MSEKEEIIYDAIINYYRQNRTMPSIRYLQKELGYKSTNSIYRYLLSLEKQYYLVRNNINKLVINREIQDKYKEGLKIIDVINSKKKIKQYLNKNKKYCAFIIKNDNLKKEMIKKNDILIIELNAIIQNNELGLFIVDNSYCIMNYFYENGFYILSSDKKVILNKINYVGKVIQLERTI